MKRTDADAAPAPDISVHAASARSAPPRSDFVLAAGACAPSIAREPHVIAGDVLWTLTKDSGIAQARRWQTPRGYELEVQIWIGPRREGQEDLSWSQVFTAEDALAETAGVKKRQLETLGWIEELDALYQSSSATD